MNVQNLMIIENSKRTLTILPLAQPGGQTNLHSGTGIAEATWGILWEHRRGLPETGPFTVLRALECTMMSTLRHVGSFYQDSTVCSTSFVAFTAGYNGDRESNFSVNRIGHAVCLAVSYGFDLMPWKDTACWETFPA